jgi:hypothetical protein
MTLTFEDRLSDSPFVEKVWRSRSDRGGPFVSIAQSHFEMAVTRHQGRTFITLRGPETQATRGDCPPDGEWLGIRFRLGTFMPRLIPGELRDRNDVTLPDATRRSFWLNGSACDYPDFENADTFVDRLVRKGLLMRDPVVDTVLRGGADAPSENLALVRRAQQFIKRYTLDVQRFFYSRGKFGHVIVEEVAIPALQASRHPLADTAQADNTHRLSREFIGL